MDSRRQRPPRKTLQWQLAQEQPQQSPSHGPSAASVQPDTKSNPQEDLQTQDWVSEPPKRRSPGSRWSVSIEERRRLAMLRTQNRTNTARALSRDKLGLQTVPSPLTGPAPTSPNQVPETTVDPSQDIVQMVAQLISEGVDRDVLLPYPLEPTMYPNAF
ncbi:testis-expressed protein 22 [Peromyscus eremicus]|uniref:testis-expressed protein 22 n=1 Tax=Peromyscus eremicus TaxID=42410 RepID=UPI0027DEA3CC|nr:testis-expressed protein 22 [Peromyscus eremicus]